MSPVWVPGLELWLHSCKHTLWETVEMARVVWSTPWESQIKFLAQVLSLALDGLLQTFVVWPRGWKISFCMSGFQQQQQQPYICMYVYFFKRVEVTHMSIDRNMDKMRYIYDEMFFRKDRKSYKCLRMLCGSNKPVTKEKNNPAWFYFYKVPKMMWIYLMLLNLR